MGAVLETLRKRFCAILKSKRDHAIPAGCRVGCGSAIDIDDESDLIKPFVKNRVSCRLTTELSVALGETDNTIKKATVIAASTN